MVMAALASVDTDARAATAPPRATGTTRLSPRWQAVKRLLVVRTDNLGDVLMTTPALQALRHSLPAAHITLLASSAGLAAAAHLPMIDAVWRAAPSWTPAGLGRAGAPSADTDHALIERLAAGAFDAAVIFTVCTQSALPAALTCRLAGIPLVLAHARENPYALLSDWVPECDVVVAGMRHEVQRQLDLVRSIGCDSADDRLHFALDDAARTRARRLLKRHGIEVSRPFVLLHPGASAPSRRWPAQGFGRVAATLASDGWPVLLVGANDDRSALDEASAAMQAAGAAPPPVLLCASLEELAALIDAAALLVANNSGPSHLAAALGTPVVTLYALTNPQHTPWRVASRVLSHDVPCRWCLRSQCPQQHHACLRAVREEAVAAAALELLTDDPAPSATRGPVR
jgi:lipopolysaccharide heptosyltransferase II